MSYENRLPLNRYKTFKNRYVMLDKRPIKRKKSMRNK